MSRILIIYYHEVVPDGCGSSYQKHDASKFEQEMRCLRERGYHTLLFSELNEPLPERSVIVSFDDGYQSVLQYAAPIMKQYGIKGNVYLPTGRIGASPEFMDWPEIETMRNSGDWYFAAHTHSHADIRTLTRESAAAEILQSTALFEQHLGYRPDVFCMPYGSFDRGSVKLIRELGGYRYLLGSFYGVADLDRADRTVLPRIGISNDDTLADFEAKLDGKRNWKGPLQRARLAYHNLFRRGGA